MSSPHNKTPIHIFINAPVNIQAPLIEERPRKTSPPPKFIDFKEIAKRLYQSKQRPRPSIDCSFTFNSYKTNKSQLDSNIMKNTSKDLKRILTITQKIEICLPKATLPSKSVFDSRQNGHMQGAKNLRIIATKARKNSLERMQIQKTKLWKALVRSIIHRTPLDKNKYSINNTLSSKSPPKVEISLSQNIPLISDKNKTTKNIENKLIRFPPITSQIQHEKTEISPMRIRGRKNTILSRLGPNFKTISP